MRRRERKRRGKQGERRAAGSGTERRTERHRSGLALAPIGALNVRLDECEHRRGRLNHVVADDQGDDGEAAAGGDSLGRVVLGILVLVSRERREAGKQTRERRK
jgi:hypothetical protein